MKFLYFGIFNLENGIFGYHWCNGYNILLSTKFAFVIDSI